MTVFYKVVTTLWLFLIIQTASSPLKGFIQSWQIKDATRPIAGDYIYVDKTCHALKLCEVSGGRYFFVRPRGFGKTTFLRSLQRIFDGTGRGIFNGTHIHESRYSWNSYPVLFMDLGNEVVERNSTCNEVMKEQRDFTLLERKVDEIFMEFKAQHNLSKPKESRFSDEFDSILKEMKNVKGKSTVVLIDEYDFAILNNHVSCPAAAKINSDLVEDFFLQLRGKSEFIRFAFITGISKSVFSTLASAIDLEDITDTPMFHDIAGITDLDLDKYYGEHIAEACRFSGKPKENVTSELKRWYDGYKFSVYSPSALYNPKSVHDYLQKGVATEYRCVRKHATFLYNQMVQRMDEFMGLDLKNGVSSYMLGGTSLDTTDPVVLIYDAGYLTIESVNNGIYRLRFVNEEMELTFYRDMSEAAKRAENGTIYEIGKIGLSLRQRLPAVTNFMNALDVCMMKVGRLPFEEWYDYQTMKFIEDAGLDANRQTTLYTNDFGKKIIDVTAHSRSTKILIEVKFNRRNNYDAWAAVNKSIKATLDENRQKATPFQYILAAGITFTQNDDNRTIDFYQAKLFAKNGKVINSYQSENILQYQSERRSTQRPPLFLRDDLFLTNQTHSSEFDDYT